MAKRKAQANARRGLFGDESRANQILEDKRDDPLLSGAFEARKSIVSGASKGKASSELLAFDKNLLRSKRLKRRSGNFATILGTFLISKMLYIL